MNTTLLSKSSFIICQHSCTIHTVFNDVILAGSPFVHREMYHEQTAEHRSTQFCSLIHVDKVGSSANFIQIVTGIDLRCQGKKSETTTFGCV